MPTRTPLQVLALSIAALLAAPAAAAPSGDEPEAAPPPAAAPAANVSDKVAKDELDKFEQGFDTEDLDYRIEAVERLRKTLHPTVADRLFKIATEDASPPVRAAAFRGLGLQKPSAKTIGPRLSKILARIAEENRKAKAKGDYGVKVDVKTGDVDTTSDEGKALLRAKRERGKMLAEAVRALDALEYREKDSVDALREFLSDGNDDLVAMSLGMLGKWKVWPVIPDIRELFEIYPKEDEFQTGSVTVDTGAAGNEDSAAAKRKWMAKFGDPDRRRPRPKVVKALKKALLDITGKQFEDPKALREFEKEPENKRRIKNG
ncbi:MAG TPA: hypothetical protein VFS92_01950 [Planctomycetota bacterium]|nr:hypothetical protein [Planctomycetota bacterium]